MNNSDVNNGNIHGYTPLHLAVRNGNIDIAHSLIMAGSDLTMKSNAGEGIRYLVSEEEQEVFDVLISKALKDRAWERRKEAVFWFRKRQPST